MKKIPRNDAEANVLAYQEMEKPLRETLLKHANRNARSMLQRVTSLLESHGYDGTNGATILTRQASAKAVMEIERLAQGLPDGPRKQLLSKLYGQIGAGSLTVRKAVYDLINYGSLEGADKLYGKAKKTLQHTAKEGMLRGEFMVQKSLGVGWQMETPNLAGIDAFLKDRWSQKSATDYLKPMSEIVKKEVEQSIFLGESPQKMSLRIRVVEDINKVRADRNARTITTAVANEAQMDAYKRDGVKHYEWVATFDERTCSVCGGLDGQQFPLGKGKEPPAHPNCRCTTKAVLRKDIEDRLNANLAKHAGDYKAKYVPPNMHYEEWAEKNVTDKPVKSPLRD